MNLKKRNLIDNVKRLNYSNEVIRDSQQMLRDFSQIDKNHKMHLKHSIELLKDSIKFVLPEESNLNQISVNSNLSFFKIPYPNITIESNDIAELNYELTEGSGKILTSVSENENGIKIYHFIYLILNDVKYWTMYGKQSYISYEQIRNIISLNIKDSNIHDMSTNIAHLISDKIQYSFISSRSEEDSNNFVYNSIKHTSLKQILTLWFCLNNECIEEETLPASKSLKRKLRNNALFRKIPPFEYKALNIDLEKVKSRQSSKHSSHASPRMHSRRGHLRRYSSGKTVWIEPMVVGKKENGIIVKDYDINTSQGEEK